MVAGGDRVTPSGSLAALGQALGRDVDRRARAKASGDRCAFKFSPSKLNPEWFVMRTCSNPFADGAQLGHDSEVR